jgi:hypothetical protein
MNIGPPGIEFSLELCPPGRMTMPRIIGAGIEGGRSLSGISQAIDATGGGFVAVDYKMIQLGNVNQDRLRYFNRLGFLNGGVRSIVVPLLVDAVSPLALGASLFMASKFSDTSHFSDGSSFSQSAIAAVTVGAFALNASTIVIKILQGSPLQGGEWFGLFHPTKSNRAYLITDVDSKATNEDGSATYSVAIRPPLRGPIGDGSEVDFLRPRCVMRLAPGTTLSVDVEKYWYGTPDISFVESFP